MENRAENKTAEPAIRVVRQLNHPSGSVYAFTRTPPFGLVALPLHHVGCRALNPLRFRGPHFTVSLPLSPLSPCPVVSC